MVIKKSWVKLTKWQKQPTGGSTRLKHVFTGWFILNVIPLFVVRTTFEEKRDW